MRLQFKVFSVLFFALFLFFFSFSKVDAASISVIGKAKVLNTDNYLYFSNYNSNVVIDDSNGNFSGDAFLEDLGWVAFGTTENNQGPVNLNLITGIVKGKAKVLNTGGFIDFTGYNSNVKVSIPDGIFSGYVFSEDLGWINFADNGVSTSSSFDQAISKNNSNLSDHSAGNSSTPPACTNSITTSIPDLFEIRTNNNTATLYFAPPSMPYSSFYIAYSRNQDNWEYGTEYNQGYSGGALKFTINLLSSNTKYYFKIRAGNGCATGNWSNIVSAVTTGSNTKIKVSYKNFLIKAISLVKTTLNGILPKKDTIKKVPSKVEVNQDQAVPPERPEIITSPPQKTTIPTTTSQSAKKKFCILWWCF